MIDNWIANLNAAKMTYPNPSCIQCQVHSGFYNDYQMLKANVEEYIVNIIKLYPSSAIFLNFVGHSLGGAFATLSAVQNKYLRPNLLVYLFTYGQPRVGNDKFAKYVNQMTSKTQRAIHYADIVPHLPPQSFGYKHYNMQYWYEQLMVSYKICISENPSCSNSIALTDYSIDDHSMSWYVKIHKIRKGTTSCVIDSVDVYNKLDSFRIVHYNVTAKYQGFIGQYWGLQDCVSSGDKITTNQEFQIDTFCWRDVYFRKQQVIPIKVNATINKFKQDQVRFQFFGYIRVHITDDEQNVNNKQFTHNILVNNQQNNIIYQDQNKLQLLRQ